MEAWLASSISSICGRRVLGDCASPSAASDVAEPTTRLTLGVVGVVRAGVLVCVLVRQKT